MRENDGQPGAARRFIDTGIGVAKNQLAKRVIAPLLAKAAAGTAVGGPVGTVIAVGASLLLRKETLYIIGAVVGLFVIIPVVVIFSIMVIGSSQFVASSQLGSSQAAIGGVQTDPNLNHLAGKLENALAECNITPLTKEKCEANYPYGTWTSCLLSKGVPFNEVERIILDLCNSAKNNNFLQCVGFKKSLEPKLPLQNACWFATSANINATFVPKDPSQVKPGDNAVWGSSCCSQCSAQRIDCCGHIGMITDVITGDDGIAKIKVTQAWGQNGTVTTIDIPITEPSVIIRY